MVRKPHPSLFAPFNAPPLLHPKPGLGPYDMCWCESGKKFKWCHMHREKEKLPAFGAQMHSLRAEMAKGYCSHPDASDEFCGEKIIRAHTVQKRVGLAAIAENGHVISVKNGVDDIEKNNGRIIPVSVGVNNASTFPGFCNHHDTSMFRSIEVGAPDFNAEVAFLLSFRALSYELFAKRAFVRSIELQRELDKGKPIDAQILIQNNLRNNKIGAERAIVEMEALKLRYDEAFRDKRYDACKYYAISLSECLPVVSCGGFLPEFSFDGLPLQRLSRGDSAFEQITFNLTVMNGRSVVVIGWMEGGGGPAHDFAKSFERILPNERADAAVRLAFAHLENTYARPSWWEALDSSAKEHAVRLMNTGFGYGRPEHRSNTLQPFSQHYVSANVTKELTNW
ncbi:zinc chelation protein SecC [Azospirillum brasilense]|uniref:Zinc chelation protein SecC n=2 Tax=Azospirillum brasilense TaxID=192 RepID=A0A6L3ARJ2_AZOBR|nr:zinc chelation protein SecC [Azospirillum brasilense]